MSTNAFNAHQYTLSLRSPYLCVCVCVGPRPSLSTLQDICRRSDRTETKREQSAAELNLLKPIAHGEREGGGAYTGNPGAGRNERKRKAREGDGGGLGAREQRSRAEGSSYEGFGLTQGFVTRTQHAGNETRDHTHTHAGIPVLLLPVQTIECGQTNP